MKKPETDMARTHHNQNEQNRSRKSTERHVSGRHGGSACAQPDELGHEERRDQIAPMPTALKAQMILSRIRDVVGHQKYPSEKTKKVKERRGENQKVKRTTRKERKSKKNMCIWLPKSLDLKALHRENPTIEVDPAENPRRKNHESQKVSIRDLQWVVGEIVYISHMKRDYWNKWVNIPSSFWDKHTTGNYRDLIRWLIKYEVIRENPHYSSNEGNRFTKSYSLHPRIMNDPIVEKFIKKKVEYDQKPVDEVTQHLNRWLQDPNLTVDYELTRQIALELDVHKRNSWELNQRAYKMRKGGKRDTTSYRFHSVITRTPRVMRSAITFAGEHLVAVDIKNSQPFLFAMKIKKVVEEGKLYTVLGRTSWSAEKWNGRKEQSDDSKLGNEIHVADLLEVIRQNQERNQESVTDEKNKQHYERVFSDRSETNLRRINQNVEIDYDSYHSILCGDVITYVPTKYTEERNESALRVNDSACSGTSADEIRGVGASLICTSECHDGKKASICTGEYHDNETASICTSDCHERSPFTIANSGCHEESHFSRGTSESHVIESEELKEYQTVCIGSHWDDVPDDLITFIELSHAGLFYEGLGVLWQTDRETAKKIFYTILFGRNKRRSNEERVFEAWFPNVYRAIKWAKIDGHNKVAIELQRIESDLVLDTACVYLMEHHPDVPLFTVHDSILTLQEHAALIEKVIRETFSRAFDVEPILKTRPWTSENIDARNYEVGDEWYEWDHLEDEDQEVLWQSRLHTPILDSDSSAAVTDPLDYADGDLLDTEGPVIDDEQDAVDMLGMQTSADMDQYTMEEFTESEWRRWDTEADTNDEYAEEELRFEEMERRYHAMRSGDENDSYEPPSYQERVVDKENESKVPMTGGVTNHIPRSQIRNRLREIHGQPDDWLAGKQKRRQVESAESCKDAQQISEITEERRDGFRDRSDSAEDRMSEPTINRFIVGDTKREVAEHWMLLDKMISDMTNH